MTDNCGEVVLDKLLIRQMQRENPDLAFTVIGNILSFCVMLSIARKKETFSVSLRERSSGCLS